MKIHILLKSTHFIEFYKSAIKEYEKRLSRYCKLQFTLYKNPSELNRYIKQNSYIFFITHNANYCLSSECFAEKIQQLGTNGISDITFIISDDFVDCTSDQLCLSPLKMDPHLTATILIEQIYRAFRIIHNEPYHK